jgi:PIN domain nuclease of toxin-antitoxin system
MKDLVRRRTADRRVRYEELTISGAHALAVRALPALHKDPFDRILLAQAQCESLTLLTVDKELGAYGPPCRVV